MRLRHQSLQLLHRSSSGHTGGFGSAARLWAPVRAGLLRHALLQGRWGPWRWQQRWGACGNTLVSGSVAVVITRTIGASNGIDFGHVVPHSLAVPLLVQPAFDRGR